LILLGRVGAMGGRTHLCHGAEQPDGVFGDGEQLRYDNLRAACATVLTKTGNQDKNDVGPQGISRLYLGLFSEKAAKRLEFIDSAVARGYMPVNENGEAPYPSGEMRSEKRR